MYPDAYLLDIDKSTLSSVPNLYPKLELDRSSPFQVPLSHTFFADLFCLPRAIGGIWGHAQTSPWLSGKQTATYLMESKDYGRTLMIFISFCR